MKETPREVLIWQILKDEIPDDIGGTAEEYYNAGWQFQYGTNGCKDKELAVKGYEKAAVLGSVKAMTALGNLYQKMDDSENAYRWYLEAAIAGEDKEAIMKIACMYCEGNYLRADQSRALELFQLAFEKGEERAALYLGKCYENGIGTGVNMSKALFYYRSGADKYVEDCRDAIKRLKGIEYVERI